MSDNSSPPATIFDYDSPTRPSDQLGVFDNAPIVTRDGRIIPKDEPLVGKSLPYTTWQEDSVSPTGITGDVAPMTATHDGDLDDESSEAEREQLRIRMNAWMETNESLLGMVQRVTLAILDSGLLDKRRDMPYNMLQMTMPGEEKSFCMAVHLDHPLFGHTSVLFVQSDLIEFMPENTFFHDVYTAKSEDDAISFIHSLVTADLKGIQFLEDLVEKRALSQVNVFVRDLLRTYHNEIDLDVKRVKQYLADTPCVEFLNPKIGFMKDTVRFAGNIDERLFLSDPPPFYVAGDEPATESLRAHLKEFRDKELRMASVLYAAQKMCTNGGYHVYVHKRLDEDIKSILMRPSAGILDANPNRAKPEMKGAFPVNVNPDGSVAVVMVINADRIEIKSPLQL